MRISQRGSSIDKRQCTVKTRAKIKGEQPRTGVTFQDEGRSTRQYEKVSWNSVVPVY